MEDSLMSLVSKVEEAEEASYAERQLCERDRDYKDGKQLTEEERNALQAGPASGGVQSHSPQDKLSARPRAPVTQRPKGVSAQSE